MKELPLTYLYHEVVDQPRQGWYLIRHGYELFYLGLEEFKAKSLLGSLPKGFGAGDASLYRTHNIWVLRNCSEVEVNENAVVMVPLIVNELTDRKLWFNLINVKYGPTGGHFLLVKDWIPIELDDPSLYEGGKLWAFAVDSI